MRPNLDFMDKFFDKGESFQLTDKEYENGAGINLPQNSSYLLNKSALAKKCKAHGYKLRLQEKVVYFEKDE